MGALLESGLVGNIGLKHLKVIKEDTINKWDKLGFLEGLKGHLKENVAQLYENQASHLINEATSDSSSGSFETVVFPIVRRVFSKLLANEIVSVQAMNLPIGKLFFFVPKIQGYSGATADSLVPGGYSDSGSHYGPVGSPGNYPGDPNGGYNSGTPYAKNLYDLFYEGTEPGLNPAGIFDYSKGRFIVMTGDTSTVAWSNGALVVSGYTVFGEAAASTKEFRKIIVGLSGFSQSGVGKLIGPDGQEVDTESFLSNLILYTANSTAASNLGVSTYSPLLFRVVTQKYGQGIVGPTSTSTQAPFNRTNSGGNGGYYDNICNQAGIIYLEIDAQVPVCVSCGQSTPDGYSGASLTNSSWSGTSNILAAWRRYEELEFEDKIGEVSFDLESVTVSVTERKLRAQWSPELAQDVAAFHNIDAEAELTALLSEQVAAEIDREILRDLRKGAAWNLRWDYNGWKRLSSSGTTPYTQKDWNQTLITAINQISAQIHKSTLRGGANWIIVSSEISAIFDDLEYFHVSNASPEQDQFNMGIERVGTLSGRYQVYRDPYFPANTVLIGHKGTSLLDTGYIYAPYVPLQLTPTMYNPFNFTPIKGIMTRYAKKMVNNRFYGRITVDGVRTFDLNELR
jgi:hypothetical protein